jgi:hypothetical protein
MSRLRLWILLCEAASTPVHFFKYYASATVHECNTAFKSIKVFKTVFTTFSRFTIEGAEAVRNTSRYDSIFANMMRL